jgi:hypothetical protein
MGCDELLNRPVDVTGVTIAEEDQTIVVGDTLQLTATVAPSDATNTDVSWSSSDTDVATVSSSGLVTAVAAGSATITVTTDEGDKTDSISLVIKNEHIIFSLTPADTTQDTLHFELYSGPHADSSFNDVVDLASHSEVTLATVMGSPTSLIGSTKPLDMDMNNGDFYPYAASENHYDIVYAWIDAPNHNNAEKGVPILADGEENVLELVEENADGVAIMDIAAESFTITYSDLGEETGFLEGTITGTVYDVSDLGVPDESWDITKGIEYELDLVFKARIYDVNLW